MNRRRFLVTAPAALATFGALNPSRLSAAAAAPRVGCQANGFPLKPNDFPGLLAAVRKMKALGYTGFECNIRFVETEFGRVKEARRQIEDTGVAFIGPHTSMANAKPDVVARWVENIAALGGSCIVMSGSGLAADGKFSREALQKKAKALDVIGETCRRGGLRLAYHNHNPEFANHNAEITGLAEGTDPANLHFLMDAGHAHLGGGDPAAFMRKFSQRIAGCHLKTYRAQTQVPLGEGDWGFEDLAAAVKSAGWHGWLITEEGGGARGGNTTALGPDRDYIRKVFGV